MNMTEQALEARRAYYRKWRKQNPDKVRAAHDRYWTKKAAEAEKANEQESVGK